MKVRWFIEGAGCPYAQCGLHDGKVTEIPDEEIPDDPVAKARFIDEWIDDEFDRTASLYWEIESP
jgi:hypothetical protein